MVALVAACNDTPTTADAGEQDLRLAVAANVLANPGAVLVAEVSYTSTGGTRALRVLARDSLVITTGAADTPMSLTADVSACAADAVANAASCTVNVGLTLKRDGRVLDEANQQFLVTADTRNIVVPPVQLFEVNTVTIDTLGTGALEPGDTKTLTATARDKSNIVVPGRSPSWTLVSGGVTITAAGSLAAVSEGAAVVRVVLGGRTATLPLQIRTASVFSIDIAPADTSINISGTFNYRITPRSATGVALSGRIISLTTSASAIATVVGNVAAGVSAGLVTITATSTQGRAGSTVTKTTTLRVLPTSAIRVDRNAVTFDVPPTGTSATTSVVVTTDTGRTLRGLVSSVTYTPNVAPWLTQSLAGTVTPTTLSLRASAGALDTGTYVADVNLTSTLDAHVPASVRVTMRVVRVVAAPRTVTFGPYAAGTTTFPPSSVALRTSLAAVPLSGLTVRTEYIGAATGWLTPALQATTAAPTTSVLLTPNPTGVAAGTSQARVIVTSASPVISADTITVSLVVNASAFGRFSGLVVNASTQLPIFGASVTVRRADNSTVDLVTTTANGTWTSNAIPAGTYNVLVVATGYQDYLLYSQVLVGGATIPVTPLANEQLVLVSSTTATITGSIRDATTNGAISAATVELRPGANNTTGTPIATTTTNSDGTYQFLSQVYGVYTVRATKVNYAAGSVTISVRTPSYIAPVTFLSPGGATVEWRFVLSWGDTPSDLDAHLTGPLPATTARFHVYWDHELEFPYAQLDVDARLGFGPETITLQQQIAGVYRFYVDNYLLGITAGTPEIRTSTARVDVYRGNTLVGQYFPPQTTGKYWVVFEINGTVLTPINTINSTIPSLQVPASGFVRANLRSDAAMLDLMSFEPWTWVKPAGAIKRE